MDEFLKHYGTTFEQVVETYSKQILRNAYRIVRNTADAEDVAQEVYLKLFRKYDQFDSNSSLSTWINAITRNAAIDVLRARYRDPLRDPADIMFHEPAYRPSDPVEQRDLIKMVNESMEVLSPKEKKIMILFAEGYEYRELAEICGILEGTARSRLFRAREKLTLARLSKLSQGN